MPGKQYFPKDGETEVFACLEREYFDGSVDSNAESVTAGRKSGKFN
jgi:hypothetical protein